MKLNPLERTGVFVSELCLGAKKPEQLADNLAAVDVALGADELARLDAVSKLPAEYPGWMFTRQGGRRAPHEHRALTPPLPRLSAA